MSSYGAESGFGGGPASVARQKRCSRYMWLNWAVVMSQIFWLFAGFFLGFFSLLMDRVPEAIAGLLIGFMHCGLGDERQERAGKVGRLFSMTFRCWTLIGVVAG